MHQYVVNFINILRVNFLYESPFSSYILQKALLYEKRAHKMLTHGHIILFVFQLAHLKIQFEGDFNVTYEKSLQDWTEWGNFRAEVPRIN